MADMMTNFTAGDMPGAKKPVKKAAAPSRPAPVAPKPEPVVEAPAVTPEPAQEESVADIQEEKTEAGE